MRPLLTWTWPETPIVIGVVALLALVLRWISVRAIRSGVEAAVQRSRARDAGRGTRAERILAEATGLAGARHEARTRTIGGLVASLVSVLIVVVAALTVLDAVGVPLGAVIASAGIGGVALGFGAQSLVKDFLSGIFMMIEDQYGVGDIIDTGEVVGTVEDVGLRVTRIRDAGGQIWYVRNGEILRLGNLSQGWSMGSVEIPVAFDEDAARVSAVLEGVLDAVDADPAWTDVLLERPTLAGVDQVTGGTMTFRVFAKCAPNQHWGVQRAILAQAQTALRRAGIRGPALPPAGATAVP